MKTPGWIRAVALWSLVRRFLRAQRTHREAVHLARCMWKNYYRAQAPDWQPLEDTEGVLSQISNMHAGVKDDCLRYQVALSMIANDPANAVTYFEDKWREIAKQALHPNKVI